MKTIKFFTTMFLAVLFTSCSNSLKEENQTKVYECVIQQTIYSNQTPFDGINAKNAEITFIGNMLTSFKIIDEVKINGNYAKLKTSILSNYQNGIWGATLLYEGDGCNSRITYKFSVIDEKIEGTWSEEFANSEIKNEGTISSGKLIIE